MEVTDRNIGKLTADELHDYHMHQEYMKRYVRLSLRQFVRSTVEKYEMRFTLLDDAKRNLDLAHGFEGRKWDFMCNMQQYKSDRNIVRERFFREAHKKTSLKEVGDLLDKILEQERIQENTNQRLSVTKEIPLDATEEVPDHMARDVSGGELKMSAPSWD